MKSQRLAGYGPIAAFVSAGSLFVYFVLEEAGNAIVTAAPSLLIPLEITDVASLWLWVAGLVAVITSTGIVSSRLALVAAVVALVTPIVIGIAPFTLGVPLQAPSFLLLFLGVATMLGTFSIAARRTGVMRGVLPWLGIGLAVAYAICAVLYVGILLPTIGMSVFMTGFNINLLAEVAYMVWAVWVGVKLTRSKPAVSAATRAATV